MPDFLSSFDVNASASSLFASSIVHELGTGQLFHTGAANIVLFYAPSCPHCQVFAPVWQHIAGYFAKTDVRFCAVNCEVRTVPSARAHAPSLSRLSH
jgi:thiol-disulfide isomerase/thioredoxin